MSGARGDADSCLPLAALVCRLSYYAITSCGCCSGSDFLSLAQLVVVVVAAADVSIEVESAS